MDVPKRSLESATLAGDELIGTPIGDIALRHSYFDDDASRRLFDEMDYQRATQTYLWALPLINTLGMQRGSEQTFGAGYN